MKTHTLWPSVHICFSVVDGIQAGTTRCAGWLELTVLSARHDVGSEEYQALRLKALSDVEDSPTAKQTAAHPECFLLDLVFWTCYSTCRKGSRTSFWEF